MATHFNENHSISSIANTTDAVTAALQSDKQTESLASLWQGLTDRADTLEFDRRLLNREVRRARARVCVCDGLWDETTAAFGRATVDESGGRRDQPPYTRFFNKVPPHKVQTFGVKREIDLGRTWLSELARNPSEPLAVTWIPRIKDATDQLEAAVEARANAVKALGLHQTSEILFTDDVNKEIDILEGELKKVFAGASGRADSFLAATRPARRRRSAARDSETGQEG